MDNPNPWPVGAAEADALSKLLMPPPITPPAKLDADTTMGDAGSAHGGGGGGGDADMAVDDEDLRKSTPLGDMFYWAKTGKFKDKNGKFTEKEFERFLVEMVRTITIEQVRKAFEKQRITTQEFKDVLQIMVDNKQIRAADADAAEAAAGVPRIKTRKKGGAASAAAAITPRECKPVYGADGADGSDGSGGSPQRTRKVMCLGYGYAF